MRYCYLGIDPGINGGMAFITPNRLFLSEMPNGEEGIWRWIESVIDQGRYAHALETRTVLEKVTGYVAEKKEKGEPGSRVFQFGVSYGNIRMALTVAGFIEDMTYHCIHPLTWQKVYGLKRGVDEKGPKGKTKWKGRLQSMAKSLFPTEKPTLKTCDALLLAEYCRRMYEVK